MPPETSEWTDAALKAAAGECRELSCVYHGYLNRELRKRAMERHPAGSAL